MTKNKKSFNWDGRTRVVTDLYRKNFDKIFKKKVLDGEDPFDKNKDEEEYLKELKKKL
jgi:hypothetical protein|tara:strand:+ start:651 stop:824 length:174 start_codon:yes stop_codon:yes gene_type:complete